jgi:tRNA-specific 2-thiouridylase
MQEKEGKVLNEKGEEIGFHDGAVFHTLGERHGFTITKKTPNDGAYYIVGKDIEKNILIVSQDKNRLAKSTDIFLLKNSSCSPQSGSQASLQDGFCISLINVNWISEIPKEDKKYTAQIRYHGEFFPCKIKYLGAASEIQIIFEKPVLVAPGQSIVLYDKDIVLGGGVVK